MFFLLKCLRDIFNESAKLANKCSINCSIYSYWLVIVIKIKDCSVLVILKNVYVLIKKINWLISDFSVKKYINYLVDGVKKIIGTFYATVFKTNNLFSIKSLIKRSGN